MLRILCLFGLLGLSTLTQAQTPPPGAVQSGADDSLIVKVVGLRTVLTQKLLTALPTWQLEQIQQENFLHNANQIAEQELYKINKMEREFSSELSQIGNRWVLVLTAEKQASTAPKANDEPADDTKQNVASQDGELTLNISGVEDQLKNNIAAYLSPLPKTAAERSSFLFSVKDKANNAMQALGYFHSSFSHQLKRNDDNTWVLDFKVTPGEPTRYQHVTIQIEGEARNDRRFKALLKDQVINIGDVVHQGEYETLKAELLNLSLTRGYFDGAMITHKLEIDRENHSANLVLLFRSGPRYRIGEINFSQSEIKPELLQILVPFKEGELYHSNKIARLNSSLLASGYFADIKVLPQPDKAEKGRVPIEVQLTAPPSHSIDLGVGYATDTGAQISTTWRTPVINRHGHSQETKLELSEDSPELTFQYRIPFEHPTLDRINIGGRLASEKFGDIDTRLYEAGVGRSTIMPKSWTRNVSLRYLYEDWTQGEDTANADYLMPGLSFSQTRRQGPPLDPTDGWRQFYQVEHADPAWGSSQRVTRVNGQLRWVKTPVEKHRFTARLDVGASLVSDDELLNLAPSLRYFAGGDQSVRGFSYNSLSPRETVTNNDGTTSEILSGGRYLLAGSLEYQYYFLPAWRVALFTDRGNAFNDPKIHNVEFEASYGAGIHWISPVGPIKFEVAYGFTDPDPNPTIHLTIGSEL